MRPELAVPGDVVDRRLGVVVLVLDHVVERDDQPVLRVAVHPAVLHLDDVGRGARLQRRQHPLRQPVRGGDLEPERDPRVLRLELRRQLPRPRLAPVRRPPDDLAGHRRAAGREARDRQGKQRHRTHRPHLILPCWAARPPLRCRSPHFPKVSAVPAIARTLRLAINLSSSASDLARSCEKCFDRGRNRSRNFRGPCRPNARPSTDPRRVTMAEVAAAAEVSVATVSKVLNGRADVASDTRRRVEAVLAASGYDPRRRKPERPWLIDLVFSELGPYATEIIRGAEEAANCLRLPHHRLRPHRPGQGDPLAQQPRPRPRRRRDAGLRRPLVAAPRPAQGARPAGRHRRPDRRPTRAPRRSASRTGPAA